MLDHADTVFGIGQGHRKKVARAHGLPINRQCLALAMRRIRAHNRSIRFTSEDVDMCLRARRDGASAKRFFKRLLRSHGEEPRELVTDNKLCRYGRARYPGDSGR